MENIALTCRACNTANVWPQTISRTMSESNRMIKFFVCPPCLFPTSLNTMIDNLPDYETETITMPDTIKTDETITDAPTEKRITRKVESRDCSKVRLPELFKLGIVRKGDKIQIGNKTGSFGIVLNDRQIQLNDLVVMSWNEYGQKFTGHKAVNIYKHVLVNGVLLESLRRKA